MSIIEKALRKDGVARPTDEGATQHPVEPVPERAREDAGGAAATGGHRGRYFELDHDRLAGNGLLTPEDTKSRLAEEFRLIKRPIINNIFGPNAAISGTSNLVMITSALPGEGKTFCTLNLALSISREVDRTVLLIDADVANPAFPRCIGTPSQPGLLDVLTDRDRPLSDVIVRTSVPNLSVIPAGARHGHSTELLGSDQMAALAGEMAQRYPDRIVIFDSPPLLSASEASVLAEHMGQIVMVVEADRTPEAAVKHGLELLEKCDVVMTLLNKARGPGGGGYGYGYGCGYGYGYGHYRERGDG